MANWNRRSRVSQNRNRRQSLRRPGSAAVPVPPPAPLMRADILKGKKMTGKDATGDSVCPPLPQQDCTRVPACRWNSASANGKRAGYCSRKPGYEGMSQSAYESSTAALDAKRKEELRKLYLQEKSESEGSQDMSQESYVASSQDSSMDSVKPSPVFKALPVFRGSRVAAAAVPQPRASKKALAPAQLKRAAAKASGVAYVPFKSSNVPMGCVVRNYELTNKNGTKYSQSRCVDSKDPDVNDSDLCMVNPETNKCKKVVRA
jgi:hypothetical protein